MCVNVNSDCKSLVVYNDEKNSPSNFLNDRYLVSQVNFVICVDQSFLDKKRNLSFLLALDLSSRSVLGHFFKSSPIHVEDLVVFFTRLLEVRGPLEVIHSDRESLFKNDVLSSFFKKHNIRHSRGSTLGHNNQVIERLNRTLKFKMKTLLLNTPGVKMTLKNFRFSRVSAGLLEKTLHVAIENYNNSSHPYNYNMSPNNYDLELLSEERKGNRMVPVGSKDAISSKVDLRLSKNDDSKEAKEIRDIRFKVAKDFKFNWEEFFFEFRADQIWQNEQMVFQNRLLLEQNLKLQGSVTELRSSLEFLTEEAEVNKELRLRKERAKEKRKLAVKQPSKKKIFNFFS